MRCRKVGLFWTRGIRFDRQKHQSRQIKWAEGAGKLLLTSRIGPKGPQALQNRCLVSYLLTKIRKGKAKARGKFEVSFWKWGGRQGEGGGAETGAGAEGVKQGRPGTGRVKGGRPEQAG